MVGKSHQLVGFTSVYSIALLVKAGPYNWQTLLFSVLLISLGSLTPDLDSQENKLYTLVPIGSGLVSEVGERLFGRHRSISHSFVGTGIVLYLSHMLIYMIPLETGLSRDALWYSYGISFISHLFADFITKEGIPLLWPIKFRFGFPPFKFMRMRTGGFVETVVVRAIIIVYLIVISYLSWRVVLHLFI